MPRVGREVTTPEGLNGTVLENNVITERTRVKVILNDGSFDIKEYEFRKLIVRGGVPRHEAVVPSAQEDDSASDELPKE